MKILYLCSKKYHDTKMDRVRFHQIEAIGRHEEVQLRQDGPGFKDFNIHRSIEEFQPDLIDWYKPLEIPGYKDVKIPRCIRYNEMYDIKWTTKEIKKSNSDIVICHHLNDMPNYKLIKSAKFLNIPHCAEKTVFKDYGQRKIYDVLLTGRISASYPLRTRFEKLIKTKMSKYFNCEILSYPGFTVPNLNHPHVLDGFARMVNQSKIALTCSSKYKYALAKYIEIPMCGSLLAADLPDERHEFFKKYMLVIDPSDSDQTIIDKLAYYIENDEEREKLIFEGSKLMLRKRTQEVYADRFVKIIKELI